MPETAACGFFSHIALCGRARQIDEDFSPANPDGVNSRHRALESALLVVRARHIRIGKSPVFHQLRGPAHQLVVTGGTPPRRAPGRAGGDRTPACGPPLVKHGLWLGQRPAGPLALESARDLRVMAAPFDRSSAGGLGRSVAVVGGGQQHIARIFRGDGGIDCGPRTRETSRQD